MLPPPTHLPEAVHSWSAEELFWIVKNGLKYTGMPAWPAPDRHDEIWALVAFLRKLPEVDARAYHSLALGSSEQIVRSAREIAKLGTVTGTISACARCHDGEAAAPSSRLVPKLAAQSAEYLKIALQDYTAGRRQSGMMQAVAAELSTQDIAQLSTYYAGLSRHPSPPERKFSPDRVRRGQILAMSGSPRSGIPPCLSCHGDKALANYPRLTGQSREYLVGQLRIFKRNLRNKTAQAAIMTVIASRLSGEQIRDVAEFFEASEPNAGELSIGTSP
jgi:cytochrome c553